MSSSTLRIALRHPLAGGVVACLAFVLALTPCFAGDDPPEAQSSVQAGAPPAEGKVDVDAKSGSVSGALQGQEGVRIQTMCTHCNSANIQVGGLSADLVPLSFGGYPLFGGLATSFVMSMLPSDSIAEAQIIRGPGLVEAPPAAAGGVIQFEPAQPGELPWGDLILDAGSFGRRTGAVRAAGPVTSWLAGTLTAGSEKVDPVDANGDGWNDVASVDRRIADARLILTPNRDHRVEFGFSRIKEDNEEGRGAFDRQRAFEVGDPNRFFWVREDTSLTRNEYRAGWEWRLPGSGTLTLRGLAADRDQSVFSQETAVPDNSFFSDKLFERYKIEEEDRWAGVRFGQPIGLSWRLVAGAETSTERVTAAELAEIGTRGQDSRDETQIDSGYLSTGFTPSAHWDLEGGVRYDRVELRGATKSFNATPPRITTAEDTLSRTSPRLTVKYRPADAWMFRLVAGRTVRAPRPILSEVCCGRRYISNVEAGVRPETATTYALESIYQPSPTLKASLYVARTDFDDFVQQFVAFSLFYRQIYANANVPSVRSETAEIVAQWSPTRTVRLDGSIGWLTMANQGDERVPIRYVPESGTAPIEGTVIVDRIPNRPSRTASAGVTLTLPREFVVSLQSSYTGPQQIQQWLAADPEKPDFNGVLSELRSIGGFWLTNLSLTAPLGTHVEALAGIDNIGDEVQTDLGDPSRDYNWGPLTGRAYRLGLRFRLPR